MCCFSGRVQAVKGTQIFARLGSDNRQFLVYEMRYQASDPVAMILPLPVSPNAGENALRFYNLQNYTKLFADLLWGFGFRAGGRAGAAFGSKGGRPLAVEMVGDFVASYVPTQADFVRLDPRFRLSKSAFRALPHYAEWGYAVFQLRQSPRRPTRVHPMAFSFPVREGGKLFFPTVHIHDGKVHPTEHFDHTLYAQWDGTTGGTLQHIFSPSPWKKAPRSTAEYVDVAKTQGIIDARLPVHRCELRGKHPNRDTWVSPADLT
jgi:hypothetical protein